jgi:hypothetical protein
VLAAWLFAAHARTALSVPPEVRGHAGLHGGEEAAWHPVILGCHGKCGELAGSDQQACGGVHHGRVRPCPPWPSAERPPAPPWPHDRVLPEPHAPLRHGRTTAAAATQIVYVYRGPALRWR